MSKVEREDFVVAAIRHEIERRVEDMIDEEIANASDRVTKRLREITGQIALSVLSEYEVSADTKRIVITVRNLVGKE